MRDNRTRVRQSGNPARAFSKGKRSHFVVLILFPTVYTLRPQYFHDLYIGDVWHSIDREFSEHSISQDLQNSITITIIEAQVALYRKAVKSILTFVLLVVVGMRQTFSTCF